MCSIETEKQVHHSPWGARLGIQNQSTFIKAWNFNQKRVWYKSHDKLDSKQTYHENLM